MQVIRKQDFVRYNFFYMHIINFMTFIIEYTIPFPLQYISHFIRG